MDTLKTNDDPNGDRNKTQILGTNIVLCIDQPTPENPNPPPGIPQHIWDKMMNNQRKVKSSADGCPEYVKSKG